MLQKKIVDLVSGDEKLEIRLTLPYASKTFLVSKKNFTYSALMYTLISQGLNVEESEENGILLKEVLRDEEAQAPIFFEHREEGFRTVRGKKLFLADNPIGAGLNDFEKASKYVRGNSLKPRGSAKKWRKFLCQNVAKNASLSLALLLGATAPVGFVLKEEGVFTDIPIWGIVNDSSTGKSSVLTLIASPWFSPRENIHGFNATSNGLSALMSQKSGYPLLLDDATYTPRLDWGELIYKIADGKSKLACNGDLTLKEVVDFSTAVIITSETSILERTSENGGHKARIVEFSLSFFECGEDAEKTKEFASQNYGFATAPVAELLLNEDFVEKLVKKYKRIFSSLASEITIGCGIDRRLTQRLALILVSGWVLQRAIKVDFHLNKVKKLLITVFSSTKATLTEQNAGEKLYFTISDYILKNQSKFPAERTLLSKGKHFSHCDFLGVRGYNGAKPCIWILKSTLEKALSAQQEFSFRAACKKLHKAGYLEVFYGDRYLTEKNFGIAKSQYYCIYHSQDNFWADRIQSLPAANRTMLDIEKNLNEDYFGVEGYKNNMILENDDVMEIRFAKLSAQEVEMTLNSRLKNALNLIQGDKIYIVPIASLGILIMSKVKLTIDAPYIRFDISDGEARVKNKTIKFLIENLNIKIPLYSTISFTDIILEGFNTDTIAIVNIKNDSSKKNITSPAVNAQGVQKAHKKIMSSNFLKLISETTEDDE